MIQARRAAKRPVIFLIPLLLWLAAGCYSSNYAREITANTSLLTDFADKLLDYADADFVLSGRAVNSEEMAEFYYVLRKARSFTQSVSGESKRESYQKFVRLEDTYEQMVKDADLYRLQAKKDSSEQKQHLAQAHQRVIDAAHEVLSALAAEQRRG